MLYSLALLSHLVLPNSLYLSIYKSIWSFIPRRRLVYISCLQVFTYLSLRDRFSLGTLVCVKGVSILELLDSYLLEQQ